MNWPETLERLREPILVIGNPPWVTNSAIGALGGRNLPSKSNFRGFNGFEAITGKSNFDISEWMLLHFLKWMSGKQAILAMLCKTGVARKVLQYAWTSNLEIEDAKLFLIDASKHFGASVDACLLVCVLRTGGKAKECTVFSDLGASPEKRSIFAFRNGRLIADLESYNSYGHVLGKSPIKWRSGVKHDCSKVMELRRIDSNRFQNGLGESVTLEPTNLYPMLKSSDLLKPQPIPSRYMLVTQRTLGEDTVHIEQESPYTWKYLQSHVKRLDKRRSSIYRNRPRFSVFGVGSYSFAPWKVAVAGFSKRLEFHCVGPHDKKPVVVDDTCYFLPCNSEDNARLLVELLSSRVARGFFRSLIFWDAKRPVTAQLLATLDLRILAKEAGIEMLPVWMDFEEKKTARLL